MEFSWWFLGGLVFGSMLFNVVKRKPLGWDDVMVTSVIIGIYCLACVVL